jgi:hypothetical protein
VLLLRDPEVSDVAIQPAPVNAELLGGRAKLGTSVYLGRGLPGRGLCPFHQLGQRLAFAAERLEVARVVPEAKIDVGMRNKQP